MLCVLFFRPKCLLPGQIQWLTPIIPASWEVEIGGLWFKASQSWWYTLVIPASREAEAGGSGSEAICKRRETLYEKQLKNYRYGSSGRVHAPVLEEK
jgi:hypothetical protein